MFSAGFGLAGFISLFTGSSILTALYRSTLSGSAFFIVGLLLTSLLYDGPIKKPASPVKLKTDEERNEES
jgi:hypothetical protein